MEKPIWWDFLKHLLLIGGLVLFLLACDEKAEDVVPLGAEQVLQVEFQEQPAMTYIRASFFDADTGGFLQLADDATILAMGEEMNYSKDDYFNYHKSFEGVSHAVDFDLNRPDGFHYEKIFSLEQVQKLSLPENFNSISLADGFELKWEGKPVGEGERVRLILKTPNGELLSVETPFSGEQSLIVRPDLLSNVEIGDAEVLLERIKSEQEGKTARIDLVYSTGFLPVEIKE
ncbi:hypothetical protein V6R21_20540 [Limibacter armeniacum]|uniref:hypothetical protein n=1 Tax=Limibacter armeniacum TaxID=466084 RepID=UPI002FE60CB7